MNPGFFEGVINLFGQAYTQITSSLTNGNGVNAVSSSQNKVNQLGSDSNIDTSPIASVRDTIGQFEIFTKSGDDPRESPGVLRAKDAQKRAEDFAKKAGDLVKSRLRAEEEIKRAQRAAERAAEIAKLRDEKWWLQPVSDNPDLNSAPKKSPSTSSNSNSSDRRVKFSNFELGSGANYSTKVSSPSNASQTSLSRSNSTSPIGVNLGSDFLPNQDSIDAARSYISSRKHSPNSSRKPTISRYTLATDPNKQFTSDELAKAKEMEDKKKSDKLGEQKVRDEDIIFQKYQEILAQRERNKDIRDRAEHSRMLGLTADIKAREDRLLKKYRSGILKDPRGIKYGPFNASSYIPIDESENPSHWWRSQSLRQSTSTEKENSPYIPEGNELLTMEQRARGRHRPSSTPSTSTEKENSPLEQAAIGRHRPSSKPSTSPTKSSTSVFPRERN